MALFLDTHNRAAYFSVVIYISVLGHDIEIAT
jgi:hypothetical protein